MYILFICLLFFIDRSVFQIFRRFFLRKVWLLNIVPYVSEGRKLSVPSRIFDRGACVIIISLEPQKLVLMPWTQSKVMKTCVIDMFPWDSCMIIFSIKIDTILTSYNSKWGLWRHQTLETWFCSLRPRPRDENVIKP